MDQIPDLNITIASTILGSILAAIGIIRNDMYMIMAAIIISPIVVVLNDISKDVIRHKKDALMMNIILLIFIIAIAMLIGFMFAKFSNELSDDSIKKYLNVDIFYNGFIGFILGMFTAYVTSIKNAGLVELPLVGVAVAVILLPPFVDVGLRLGQKSLNNNLIYNDLRISFTNIISFLIGSVIVNGIMLS